MGFVIVWSKRNFALMGDLRHFFQGKDAEIAIFCDDGIAEMT